MNEESPMHTAPDLAEETIKIFERMRARTAAMEHDLNAWAENQPRHKVCHRHGFMRFIDWPLSYEETHRRGERFLIYKVCPSCHHDAAIIARSEWLARAGVPKTLLHATIDNYESMCVGDIDAARRFAKRKKGFLIIFGGVGLGKSHLAVAVMRLIEKGIFRTNDNLLSEVRHEYGTGVRVVVERCKKTALMVLDEIGVSTGGADDIPTIRSILMHRDSECLPTIITGNPSMEQFREIIGERIADRLKDSSFSVLTLQGQSRRGRNRRQYFEDHQ